jgi:hypothetical protein
MRNYWRRIGIDLFSAAQYHARWEYGQFTVCSQPVCQQFPPLDRSFFIEEEALSVDARVRQR